MASPRILLSTLIATLGALSATEAGQVVWSSERMATNLTSNRTELGSDFRFELGGFETGFEPTAENVGDWHAHWLTVGAANYNRSAGFFAASTTIERLPAGTDTVAYIWGFNSEQAIPGAEWILLTNPEWILPTGGTGITPPQQWSTNTAAVAILGSVNALPGVHLQTAAVGTVPVSVPPTAHANAWLATFGLSDVDESQIWEIDSDGDGVANLLEYAMGSNPLIASSVSREIASVKSYEDGRALTLTFDKNTEARVHYEIEISSDLKQWESGDGVVVVVSDTPDQITVRDRLPLDASQFRYFRLSVSLLP